MWMALEKANQQQLINAIRLLFTVHKRMFSFWNRNWQWPRARMVDVMCELLTILVHFARDHFNMQPNDMHFIWTLFILHSLRLFLYAHTRTQREKGGKRFANEIRF